LKLLLFCEQFSSNTVCYFSDRKSRTIYHKQLHQSFTDNFVDMGQDSTSFGTSGNPTDASHTNEGSVFNTARDRA